MGRGVPVAAWPFGTSQLRYPGVIGSHGASARREVREKLRMRSATSAGRWTLIECPSSMTTTWAPAARSGRRWGRWVEAVLATDDHELGQTEVADMQID